MISLSIIILSYNTKDLTLSCLQSLIEQYKQELESKQLEIIIVDNASTDGSVEMIEEKIISSHSGNQASPEHPECSDIKRDYGQARMTYKGNIVIIQNRENLGFSKGCNIGTRESKGKYLLFLNSDTEVLDRGFLGMIEFLDNNQKVGILGGRLLNRDGSPQPSCGKFYALFNLFLMLLGVERFGFLRTSPPKIEKVDWVSGGCMMIKKSFLEKLNGFDEKFFMYIEDMELCYRAKELGFSTYFYPNIRVTHQALGSSNKAFAIIHIYKGLLHFYRKHKNRFQYAVAKTMLEAKAILGIAIGFLIGNLSLRETYKKALKF